MEGQMHHLWTVLPIRPTTICTTQSAMHDISFPSGLNFVYFIFFNHFFATILPKSQSTWLTQVRNPPISVHKPNMGLSENLGTFTAIAVVLAIWKIFFSYRNVARLPPGPKGLPIIGNLLDLPAGGTQEWQHWLKHKDLYGRCTALKS